MKNNKKVINAWCMYDWANSVYALTIASAIFPVYYQAVAVNAEGSDIIRFFGMEVVNSVLYSYALSFSFLISAVLLPLLSGIADYGGRKKMFLRLFVILGASSCAGLFLFEGDNVEWGIICSILACIGYSSSLVFYDAFLPEIVSEDRFDTVSAKGYSYGYIGSVILLILNIVMIEAYEVFGFQDQGTATRFAFLMVGIWWFGFAQITLLFLTEEKRNVQRELLFNGYLELLKVWKTLKGLSAVRTYLVAYFFYNMGVQTVMFLAATFGSKELRLDSSKLIMTVLLIQLVAIGGAYLFAQVSKWKGNIISLLIMNVIWIGICVGAYLTRVEMEFYVLATVVGLVMGGIQSLSRATYAKLIPKDTVDNASFFSFYDVTFNISIVFGTFSYGLIEQLTGSMRNSTIALGGFFVIGFILLSGVKVNSVNPSQT